MLETLGFRTFGTMTCAAQTDSLQLHGLFGDDGWPLMRLSTHWLPVPMLMLVFELTREMRSDVPVARAPIATQSASIGAESLVVTG